MIAYIRKAAFVDKHSKIVHCYIYTATASLKTGKYLSEVNASSKNYILQVTVHYMIIFNLSQKEKIRMSRSLAEEMRLHP